MSNMVNCWSDNRKLFLQNVTFQLEQFVESDFLKTLFDKNLQQPVNKPTILSLKFCCLYLYSIW
uniref:Uncharacterized protein n=1 Tax=Rhizophagus irregularis (strain DAOM 181602 / DAOM 197198 / MUCL 43194) TaxID=747089 RepID=U9TVS1_RHIID